MSKPIPELLQDYSLEALQTIAKFLGLGMESDAKGAYIDALARTICQPETIAASLARLDAVERLLLEHLMLLGGTAKTALMKQEMLQCNFIAASPSRVYTGSPYRQVPRYFEDVLARLTALGLVFSWSGDEQDIPGDLAPPFGLSPGTRLIIPESVRRLLPSTSEWATEIPAERLTSVQWAEAESFQRNLFLLWSYVHHNQIVLTSRGWVPKRHWSRLCQDLWGTAKGTLQARNEGETGSLHFLRLLMEEMGLLERSGQVLQTTPGSRDFLALSLQARAGRAYRAWLRTSAWDELSRIPELSIGEARKGDGRLASIVRSGRQYITGLLRHRPPERWLSVSELIEQARAVNYEFLFPRYRNHPGLHNSHRGHSNALSWELPLHDATAGWDFIEARFISRVLQEPLHWMGILSLGWENDRLIAFRISPLGAQILGITPPQPESVPKRRLIVQPDFEIFALDPVSDYTLSILDEFAERVNSDRAFEYRLTQESVYQAQQRGMKIKEIVAFLDRESSTPVPQNVKLSLQEWGRYHERIVFMPGVALCQAADPALVDGLVQDREISTLLGQRVSATAVLVRRDRDNLQRLRRALQERGILPTVTTTDPQVPPALTVHADGSIRFTHPVPDIHLLHRLRPFTEQDGSRLLLTEQAVSQAAASGWTAKEIIQLLSSAQKGPLPPDVVSKIKVWGKHYGKASLQAVTLLRLDSREVLEELLDDPLVGPLIEPFSLAQGIAIVREEDVEVLCSALRAKGVELSISLSRASRGPA